MVKLKTCIIISALCLFVGCIVTFTGVYLYTKNRLDNYEKLVETTRERNKQLENSIQHVFNRNRELEESLISITESVERIQSSIGNTSKTISELDRLNIELRKITDKYE